LSEYTVRKRLLQLGDEVRVVQTTDQRVKEYPLRYTLALLERAEFLPRFQDDEKVPFERIVEELGWSPNTVKATMNQVSRSVHYFPGGKDRRKRLYPLQYTVKLLRREAVRLKRRRERSKDEAAGYWTALAELKTAVGGLKRLRKEVERLEAVVASAFVKFRRRPPRSEVEIRTLPDPNLDLKVPLAVIVAPLRHVYWKATIPEIPFHGEGREPEEAVLALREKLASVFRELGADPTRDPEMLTLLSEFIRVRRHRRSSVEMGGVAHDNQDMENGSGQTSSQDQTTPGN
jgi:hypothetical protein